MFSCFIVRFSFPVNPVSEIAQMCQCTLTGPGGFKKDIVPLEEDESRLQSFMEFVSKISIRKEFDQSLGPINYLAARRDKAVLISFPFPVSKIILLISAEPSVDIENIAKKVVDIFSGVF